jgi:hypothetical protein
MPLTIHVWDERIPGRRTPSTPLDLRQERTTVRELIRDRVNHEVEVYNQALPEVFRGLVQPEESEQILNGFRMKTKSPLDPEAQFKRACASFERNGFLVLVDGEQVAGLDTPIELHAGSEVEFVKLVPLIGR